MCNFHESSPTVTNCTFSGNSAADSGGGMHNSENSSPTVTNCTLSGNSALYGGGMHNEDYCSPIVTNCTFSGNFAESDGGGIYNQYNSSPTVTNCILWGDSPDEIFNLEASPSVTYSDIQGGYTGTGNISADPLFVNWANGDFHLRQGSPCIDAGDNLAPALPTTDIDGDGRQIDDPMVPDTGSGAPPIVDMGADEFVPLALACEGNFDDDGDVDGSDLATFAADFGRTDCASAPACEGDFDYDNDVDGSDLAVFAADFGRTDCP